MRAVTYARVSTKHHDQNPEVQVEDLRRYCQAREWEIVSELVYNGHSGGTDNRPALKELLSLVRQRKVDAVVVVKLDRLFRSLRHLITVLEELKSLGVTFVATRDNVDWSTPGGRLFIQILGSLAEFEKSLLVERTLMGLEHARRRGKTLGRPKLRDDSRIRTLRTHGMSYRAIRTQLGCSMGAVSRALKCAPKSPTNSLSNSPTNSGVPNE